MNETVGDVTICNRCNGTGCLVVYSLSESTEHRRESICKMCNGKGYTKWLTYEFEEVKDE